jgi:hypothetical protein
LLLKCDSFDSLGELSLPSRILAGAITSVRFVNARLGHGLEKVAFLAAAVVSQWLCY